MLAARFGKVAGVDGGGFAITSTEAAPVSEKRMSTQATIVEGVWWGSPRHPYQDDDANRKHTACSVAVGYGRIGTPLSSGAMFNVLGKVVEDRLPPCALLLDGVCRFGPEGYTHTDAAGSLGEVHADDAMVTKGILNPLIGDDLGIGTGEIEAEAAVFGFHAG
jgi:hypothetical protein